MDTDVIIVGGGPVGLLRAGELMLAGVRPVVLEQLSERSTAYKANALIGQVVRFLDHRGLYQSFDGPGDRPQAAPAFLFGALLVNLSGLPGNPLHGLQIRQARLESLLEQRARDLGVDLRRGHRLQELRQDDDAVSVQVQGPDGGYEMRTAYLVGCDGARSGLRKKIGVSFSGFTDPSVISRAAHVTVPASSISTDTAAIVLPSGDRIGLYAWHRTERGAYVVVPHEPGVLMVSVIEWNGPPVNDEIPVSVDEVRASLHRVLGRDVPLAAPTTAGPHLLRRGYVTNTRIASSYRHGRVFLAGDAAHVHPAVGAPGLNLGLQDAVNLGWKLAAEVHGWAPPGLLDTYEAERRPAAERVTMQTQAQLALMSPGPAITALRQVVAELLESPTATGHDRRPAGRLGCPLPDAPRHTPRFDRPIRPRPRSPYRNPRHPPRRTPACGPATTAGPHRLPPPRRPDQPLARPHRPRHRPHTDTKTRRCPTHPPRRLRRVGPRPERHRRPP